jgi:hypothetical protein
LLDAGAPTVPPEAPEAIHTPSPEEPDEP